MGYTYEMSPDRLLAIEEVRNKFHDMRDTSRTTNQDDFMDVQFVNLRVVEDFLNRFKSTTEEILAQLFKMGLSEGSIELIPLKSESISMDV